MQAGRAYGDNYAQMKEEMPTEKEIQAKFPTEMKNEIYSKVIENYCLCVSTYLS